MTKSCSFVLDLDRNSLPTCLQPNINERRETYHGVRRQGESVGKLLLCYGDFEFLLSKEFENQMGSYFKMSDTNICEFLESNEACFVLGIEDQRKRGTDLRTNPFKGGVDGMTWDRHENMESFQGSVTRLRARKINLEMQRNKLGRV
ncbi:hypothetical protein M9H77_29442 [Catharanthus roseus]|uniref:Uncharacterized protein n=1 Tax=Catharanthus roseus TaxID=4058 RepID=A0ACB9ZUF0_CATRO|nr:hypothetical protein M9H77_29442 [Catharanthus roseus]